MTHAAPKAALDVLGNVGDPATEGGAPLHGWARHTNGVRNGLVSSWNVFRTATARAVVRTVNVLWNVILASALTPVVVSLVVVHDFLVVLGHVLHLLIFF